MKLSMLVTYRSAPAPDLFREVNPSALEKLSHEIDDSERSSVASEWSRDAWELDRRACDAALKLLADGRRVAVARDEDGMYFAEVGKEGRKEKLTATNDIEYGSAANGTHVGSGFDVAIKRESRSTALLNIISIADRQEWLGQIDVEPDQDLQRLAVEIGNCPGDWLAGLAERDTPKWDAFAERWDAIEVV